MSLLFPFTVNALSATTANTIIGTAPYLTFDGTNKATGTDELLMIKLTDGQTFNKKTNPTVAGNASTYIELPVAGQKFDDIETLIPKGSTTANLSALLLPPYSYGKDDDGDTGLTATGTLSIQITDASGATVNLTDTASACNAPYKLTLTSSSGKLETTYGTPRQTPFTGASTDYYINPKIVAPYSCYAKPALVNGSGSYAGAVSQWDPNKGFKIQNVNIPSSNFPRTAFNQAYFLLTVAGATAEEVINATGATVFSETGGSTNVSLKLTIESINVVRVTFNGPRHSSSPNSKFTPSIFRLYSDSGKTNVIYSFEIGNWFIPRPSLYRLSYPDTQTYCSTTLGTGYRVPSRADYTNSLGNFTPALTSIATYLAKCPGDGTDKTKGGNSCRQGNFTRTIGGGLFSEWSWTTWYGNSDWKELNAFWVSDAWSNLYQYAVTSSGGEITYSPPAGTDSGTMSLVSTSCVSP